MKLSDEQSLPMSRLQPLPLTTAERSRLEQVEGIVFDVQRYSIHDGPGLRQLPYAVIPLGLGHRALHSAPVQDRAPYHRR